MNSGGSLTTSPGGAKVFSMKAVWQGSISLGLLSIPVKLYGATHRKDIAFHLLHRKCSSPLQYERYCPHCDAAVRWQEVVHGYEYEKGKFVVLSDEELEGAALEGSKTLQIEGFVAPQEEPVYLERAYLLEPSQEGQKAYSLLRQAMESARLVALGRLVLRHKEHRVLLRPYEGGAIMLHTLFYPHEILKPQGLQLPQEEPSRKELQLAVELLKGYRMAFRPEGWKDAYREALMGLIQAKIQGREVKVAPVAERAKVVSLMEALKKSLQEAPRRRARAK